MELSRKNLRGVKMTPPPLGPLRVKGLKMPISKSSKNCWTSEGVYCIIYVDDNRTSMSSRFVGLKELSEFGCRFGWYFYRFICNCSCFCTNNKYERDKTLGNRLDGDQLREGNGLRRVCLLLVMLSERLVRYEVVTRFTLTQDKYPDYFQYKNTIQATWNTKTKIYSQKVVCISSFHLSNHREIVPRISNKLCKSNSIHN